jgi:type I restriction enzyme S subunit
MKSNYRSIGDFIKLVDERNKGLKVTNLVGLSISKQFIISVANTIGTDMENYKIIRKNQFACSTMQVRRDKKMPLALYTENEPAIISQAYPVFEIYDTTKLLPEYLMMWFTRSEFDREACFHAVGGVRGSLEWEDFCGMQLPIPSIEKQKEIVSEYNTIQNRIALNNQLISKLEETAQAIYKQWFVDFEFPFSDTEALEVTEKPKGYKSSGGQMVWCTELEKEIPEGWSIEKLGNISTCLDNKRRPLSQEERALKKGVYPYYGAMSILDYIDDYLYDGDYLLFSEDGANIIDENGFPAIQFVWGKFWLNNHSHILEGRGFISIQFLYNALLKTNVLDIVTGAAQPKINQQNMNSIRILKASDFVHDKFNQLVKPSYCLLKTYKNQNQKLEELKELLLAKMTRVES